MQSIANIVEKQCKKDTNIFGYEIWTHHITTVVKDARLFS